MIILLKKKNKKQNKTNKKYVMLLARIEDHTLTRPGDSMSDTTLSWLNAELTCTTNSSIQKRASYSSRCAAICSCCIGICAIYSFCEANCTCCASICSFFVAIYALFCCNTRKLFSYFKENNLRIIRYLS
jgi:hypothetical protein